MRIVYDGFSVALRTPYGIPVNTISQTNLHMKISENKEGLYNGFFSPRSRVFKTKAHIIYNRQPNLIIALITTSYLYSYVATFL